MISSKSNELLTVSEDDVEILKEFLHHAGDSLKSFRYFDSRGFDALKNHLVTLLLYRDGKPVGYGHLDKENSIVWLGIAVIETEIGRGYGKIVMDALLQKAEELRLEEIQLSVDKENLKARKLYEKYGFRLKEEKSEVVFYHKRFI